MAQSQELVAILLSCGASPDVLDEYVLFLAGAQLHFLTIAREGNRAEDLNPPQCKIVYQSFRENGNDGLGKFMQMVPALSSFSHTT